MDKHVLFTRLCLDSTGTNGQTSEVSQPVALPPGANAIQWAAVQSVLTAQKNSILSSDIRSP